MTVFAFFVVLILLPILAVLWAKRLGALHAKATALRAASERDPRSPVLREASSEAYARVIFDGFLALGVSGLAIYQLSQLSQPALSTLTNQMERRSMEDIGTLAQRGFLALIAFVVSYSLAAAIFPEILPNRGTITNRIASQAVAIAAGGVFAISLLLSDDLYTRFLNRLEAILSNALTAALAVFAIATTVYFAWKKAKVLVRPVAGPSSDQKAPGWLRRTAGEESNPTGRN